MSKLRPIRAFDLAAGALAFGLLCLAIAACGQALNDNDSRSGLVLDLGPDPACDNVVCAPGMVCQAGLCVAVDPCSNVVCAPGRVCQSGTCVVPTDMAHTPDMSSGADQGHRCGNDSDDDDDDDDDNERTPDLAKHACGSGGGASGGSCAHGHP